MASEYLHANGRRPESIKSPNPAYPPRHSSPGPILTGDPSSYVPASGTRTPTKDPRAAQKRRKSTIKYLIDELTQFRDDEEQEAQTAPIVYDEATDGPAKEDPMQKERARDFKRFDSRIGLLDKELQSFCNAVRQLGSSVGLLSSAYHLRARLAQVLHLFRENAAELFPSMVQNQPVVNPKRYSTRKRSRGSRPTQKMRPDFEISSDPERLPKELDLLAHDLHTFLECLNQIPEFTDEAVNSSVMSFQGDLKYWASCLGDFKDEFRFPVVMRHVNDLTVEMGDHLEDITEALKTFVQFGVSTIRFTQKHTGTSLQNLSTVATFFSAVTATTLQYTFADHRSHTQIAVNLLWVVSLVFSLASAINSQLAYHWRQSVFRSPRSCVPWWVSIWITRTPLMFLVSSVIAFSAGLVCFTFSVFGGTIIPIVTTVCTSFTSFALLAVGIWFAGERYTFSRTKGKRWLADLLQDAIRNLKRYTGISWLFARMPKIIRSILNPLRKLRDSVYSAFSKLYHFTSSAFTTLLSLGGNANPDLARDSLPFTNPSHVTSTFVPPRETKPRAFSGSGSRGVAVSPTIPPISELEDEKSTTEEDGSPSVSDAEVPQPSAAVINFRTLVGRVVQINRGIQPMMKRQESNLSSESSSSDALTPGLEAVASSSSLGLSMSRRKESTDPIPRRPSRVATMVPALRGLTASQYLTEHNALVRHLQFSPDGKYLATCSWDRTAIIWRVGEQSMHIHHKLAHPGAFVGQVAWSPDGRLLLTKMTRGVKLWSTESGAIRKTIDRAHDVQSVTWMPGGQSFLSVEGTKIHMVDLQGTVMNTHNFDRLLLHDVAVTPDEQRFLAVATLEKSVHGLVPSKSRHEKRIIVYNLESQTIENQVAVLHEVRDITLSVNGTLALVSYEHKDPPQLFRIDMINGRARLQLVNTYIPPSTVDFAGPSYLGHFNGTGQEDQIVLCAGKGGEVHFWDRETGTLLHSLSAPDHNSDLTGIAWNHASPMLMFASGCHDGTVKIFTAPLPSVSDVHLPRSDSPKEMKPGSSIA